MTDRKTPVLYIVVPCYNEEEVLPETSRRLMEKMTSLISSGAISASSRVLLSNDGSKDSTWKLICDLNANPTNNGLFTGICLAHNRGHQNALFAGLMEALERGCDCAVSMDADLQDDPNAIDQMVADYSNGSEIVYGVRSSRATDTGFKRNTAHIFYDLMGWLGVEMVPDSADFRLMGRDALKAMSQYGESNLFLRGIVPSLGFDTSEVYYERAERFAGESKYPLKKMISFAIEGITSFSTAPIRAVAVAGCAFLAIAVVMLVWSIVNVISGSTVPGWASLMVSIWFVGGALMLSLGIVGEYVGKTYLEAKGRPRWIIGKRLD